MHATFYMTMAHTVVVRVAKNVSINWRILAMAMKIESEELVPQLEVLASDFQTLHSELEDVRRTYESWLHKMHALVEKVETIVADFTPIWSDDYNLCGDPECYGDCRVCQEGEYDGEEHYTEKYCRRGKR